MAGIVVCGGGVCGLVSAMLLAADGHDVTVLERDPAEPDTPSEAWDAWERRGVTQFRLPHMLMPRWRYEMARELPALVDALTSAGGYGMNFFGPLRDAVPEPERFDVLTARRPVLESVIAAAANDTPGVTVRRGSPIAGLTTGPAVRDGIPHVTGVRLNDGDSVEADLVVVATGRRSPLSRWLAEIDARRPIEEEEDSGFVYYGRHVRSLDGSQLVQSPGMQEFGSVALIALPADNGTSGIGLIGTSDDAALRKLRGEAAWQRVMRRLPGGAELLESEPISPLVAMAGLEDHWRRFVVEGAPVATGLVAVADAWAATNPTLGRGVAIGTMHAVALRDTVREHIENPYELALAFDEVTEREFTPRYRATVWHDRHKIEQIAAEAEGREARHDDLSWDHFVRASSLLGNDLELTVRWANSSGFLAETALALIADPEVIAKIPDTIDVEPHGGPTRAELLDLVAG